MKNKATLYGGLMAVTWGSTFLFLKNLLGVFSPLEVSVLRYGTTGIFFLMVSWRSLQRVKFSRADGVRLVVASGMGISLNSILISTAMQTLTSSEAGMLNGTIPALTLLVERIIFKRRLMKREVAAMVVSLLGIALISVTNISASLNPWGIGLMLIGLLVWVGYGFGIQPLFDRYDCEAVNVLQSLIGAGLLLPIILAKGTGVSIIDRLADGQVLFSLIALSFVASGLGYLYYLKGIQTMGVRKISFYVNLLPVVALVEGVLIMGDRITFSHLAGICLILFSVWMIQGKSR